MENQQIKLQSYKNFYKENQLSGGKGDELSDKDVDSKELEMGIKVEKEHTNDEKLAREIALDHLAEDPHYYTKLYSSGLADELKNEDGSMKIPRVRGMVGLAKIIQVGKPSNGQCADGETSGMTNVVGQSNEKITAAGIVDKSVVTKSVGGDVAPGEGQKQGGPNSNGKIDSTPKELGTNNVGNQSVNSPHRTGGFNGTPKLHENHTNLIKTLVCEVLDEMQNVDEGWAMGEYTAEQQKAIDTLSRVGFKEVSTFPNEPDAEGSGHDGQVIVVLQKKSKIGSRQCEVDPLGLCNGQPVLDFLKTLKECHSMKVVAPRQARVQKDDHARTVQNNPNMTE